MQCIYTTTVATYPKYTLLLNQLCVTLRIEWNLFQINTCYVCLMVMMSANLIYASFWHDHNMYCICTDNRRNIQSVYYITIPPLLYIYYIIHFTHMPLITWYQREIIKIMLSWINIWAGYTCWYITNNRTAHAFRYNITNYL